MPLITWYKKGLKNESSFVIRVSSIGSDRWSIPLSLNFVRRSFSLPMPTGVLYPTLLTTHEDNGHHFIVFSYDPKPRLVLTNHSMLTLELIEYSGGVHCHPQTLYPGSETYFEPPSLAIQYPLIQVSKQHKTLSDINIQLRLSRDLLSHDLTSGDLSSINWTSPIPIQYDTQQSITLYGSDVKLSLSTSHHNDVLYISLIPINRPPIKVAMVQSTNDTVCETSSYYQASIVLEQLIVAIDKEDITCAETSLRFTLDDIRVDISHSNDNHTHLSLDMGSLQLDHLHKECLYSVVAIPYTDHCPPLQMIESVRDPFLVLRVSWVMMSNGVCINEFSASLSSLTIQIDDVLIMGTIMELVELYRMPPAIVVESLKINDNNSKGMCLLFKYVN